jgi:hypothetical protein
MSNRSLARRALKWTVGIGIALAIPIGYESQRRILSDPDLPLVIEATIRELQVNVTSPPAVLDRRTLPRMFARTQTRIVEWPNTTLQVVRSANVVVISNTNPPCSVSKPECSADGGKDRIALSVPFILMGHAMILAQISGADSTGVMNWVNYRIMLSRGKSGWHVTRRVTTRQT